MREARQTAQKDSNIYPDFSSAKNSLNGIFFTHPKIDLASSFVDQIIGTVLLFLIRAVTDSRNSSPLSNLAPVVVGLIVVVIGQSFGTMAGYAINPARDFGPRLLALVGPNYRPAHRRRAWHLLVRLRHQTLSH